MLPTGTWCTVSCKHRSTRPLSHKQNEARVRQLQKRHHVCIDIASVIVFHMWPHTLCTQRHREPTLGTAMQSLRPRCGQRCTNLTRAYVVCCGEHTRDLFHESRALLESHMHAATCTPRIGPEPRCKIGAQENHTRGRRSQRRLQLCAIHMATQQQHRGSHLDEGHSHPGRTSPVNVLCDDV